MYDVSTIPIPPKYNDPKLYDYNDTRLPKYPEYDQTTYPNAFVHLSEEPDIYTLVACVGKLIYDADDMVGPDKPGYIEFTCVKTDASWSEPSVNPDSEFAKIHGDSIIWSNAYCVNYDNSELFMKASDLKPISTHYDYNGLRLPRNPDEDDAYPYMVIKNYITNEESNTGFVQLVYSTLPWVSEGSTVRTNGDTIAYTLFTDPGQMTQNGFSELNTWLNRRTGSLKENAWSSITWTSHDIVDVNESIFMKATTPIAVSSGYLYNEHEFPALPEWDNTAYPYAHISISGSQTRFRVFPRHDWYKMTGNTMVSTSDTYVGYQYSTLDPDGNWSSLAPASISTGEVIPNPVWTNTDILNTNGSVYLPASDPIPVAGGGVILYGDPGVELPALPSDWDKITYPYACIIESSVIQGAHVLFLSSVKFWTLNDTNSNLTTTVNSWDGKPHLRYLVTDGASKWVQQNTDNNLDAFAKIVWVNEECVYRNVNQEIMWNISTKIDEGTFKYYRYGGHSFSVIPETTRPYVFITHDADNSKYYLYFSSHEFVSNDGEPSGTNPNPEVSRYVYDADEWIEDQDNAVIGILVWSNYDIRKTDLVYKFTTYEPVAVKGCLYNGIELPEFFYQVHSNYYYKHLIYDDTLSKYFMYCTKDSLVHSDGKLINNTNANISYEYYEVDGEVWSLVETDMILAPSDGIPEALWADYSIFETDGETVFLDSTSPVYMFSGYAFEDLIIPRFPPYNAETYPYLFAVEQYTSGDYIYCSQYIVSKENFHVIQTLNNSEVVQAIDRSAYYKSDFTINAITGETSRAGYLKYGVFNGEVLGRLIFTMYDMYKPQILFEPCESPAVLYNQYRYGGSNGKVFPILPECDVEKYKHAQIYVPDSGEGYELVISAEPVTLNYDTSNIVLPTTDYRRYKLVEGEPYDSWELVEVGEPELVPVLKKGSLRCSTMDFSSQNIKSGNTWEPKAWNDLTDITGSYVWTDGTNIYYSSHSDQYILNGDNWEPKEWNGLKSFVGAFIWTDGTNIYYSDDSKQYVLNGDTWEHRVWNGLTDFSEGAIWTDGKNIYYSVGTDSQYVLNGDTWEPKVWSGYTDFYGGSTWSDGVNVYISEQDWDFVDGTLDGEIVIRGGDQYILNGDTWEPKTWNGFKPRYDKIWTDGVSIYGADSDLDVWYVLNGDTWEPKTWIGETPDASDIWTDGTNIYSGNYVLTTSAPPEPEPEPEPDIPDESSYLAFASAEPFTVAVNNATKNWDGALYYSTDITTWNEWDGTTPISSAEHAGEQKIYMRGTGNSVITGYSTFDTITHKYDGKYSWALTGSNIRCDGNIENLLDYESVARGEHPTMASCCYMGLFNECSNLISAPELKATKLKSDCYAYMFCRCKGLTTAPELPATTLSTSCYTYMFFACTYLTRASALPATKLATDCYNHMYSSCSRLATLPALPATELESRCYNDMFSDCTKIKISKTQSEEYCTPYRIPMSGEYTGSIQGASCMYAMFWYAGGKTDIPWLDFNTTYYTANEVIYPPGYEPDPEPEVSFYLYNGVKLPDINTVWTDTKTYPHACIVVDGSNYILMILNGDGFVGNDIYTSTGDNGVGKLFVVEGSQWKYDSDFTSPYIANFPAIWVNTEILDTDGTVYLEGSDPEPVNETPATYGLLRRSMAPMSDQNGLNILVDKFIWSGSTTAYKNSTYVLDYPNYIFVYAFNKNHDNDKYVDIYYSGYKHPFMYNAETDAVTTALAMRATQHRPLNGTHSSIVPWGEASEVINPVITYGLDESETTFYRIRTYQDIKDSETNVVWLKAGSATPFKSTGATGEPWYEWFKEGLVLGLSGAPIPTLSSESPNYIFDPDNNVLIFNRDEGELDFQFDWDTFDLNIKEW